MFEQLVNELEGLWIACTTYPFSVTLGISITLNLVLGWKFLTFKETYDWMMGRFDSNQTCYKYQKYEKVKKPLTNSKQRIRSKIHKQNNQELSSQPNTKKK
jgi:hypothetical protein